MKNIDKVRKMSTPKLAEMLVACGCPCDFCLYYDSLGHECDYQVEGGCREGVEMWLDREEGK